MRSYITRLIFLNSILSYSDKIRLWLQNALIPCHHVVLNTCVCVDIMPVSKNI